MHVFVYGTLLPGEVRWAFLEPFVSGPGLDDHVRGTLYDTGVGYPAFRAGVARAGVAKVGVDDDGVGRDVIGMTFTLRAELAREALETLDAVEGAVDGLYRRIRVRTGRGITAWVYEYGGGLDLVPIPGGSWRRR